MYCRAEITLYTFPHPSFSVYTLSVFATIKSFPQQDAVILFACWVGINKPVHKVCIHTNTFENSGCTVQVLFVGPRLIHISFIKVPADCHAPFNELWVLSSHSTINT
ncbi:hypothetical protein GOODEAATRI_004435 [Goodea atripinnis]|uniref:Uncharacterized protein n=1 Tax=Goodea atripinnis TaxID=208336 RepID=A0ABV0PBH8_9TELE